MATHRRTPVEVQIEPTESCGHDYGRSETLDTAQSAELLELLGDAYTQRVLTALSDQARTCREIVGVIDASRATVYRRLCRLEEAGIIETRQQLDPDGHHCKQYSLVPEAIDIELCGDGLRVTVRRSSSTRSQASPTPADD
jgi:DNA-binding HxlR family transcriptional regulator